MTSCLYAKVSNLLLFNMQDNPYKKYVVIDPLLGAVTKNRDEVEEENQLAAAPQTIEAGEYYKTEFGQTYRYILDLSPSSSLPHALSLSMSLSMLRERRGPPGTSSSFLSSSCIFLRSSLIFFSMLVTIVCKRNRPR